VTGKLLDFAAVYPYWRGL